MVVVLLQCCLAWRRKQQLMHVSVPPFPYHAPTHPRCLAAPRSRGGSHGADAAACAGGADLGRAAHSAPGTRIRGFRKAVWPSKRSGGARCGQVGSGAGCRRAGALGPMLRGQRRAARGVCAGCRTARDVSRAAARRLGQALATATPLLPGIRRVFDILVNNLPLESGGGQQPPPGKLPPGWRETMHARQFIASESDVYAWCVRMRPASVRTWPTGMGGSGHQPARPYQGPRPWTPPGRQRHL